MEKKMKKLIWFLWLIPLYANAADYDYSLWNDILKNNVEQIGHESKVSYDKINFQKLDSFLNKTKSVSKKDFKLWPRQKQMAFLINEYNAATVYLIVKNKTKIESIKDIGWLFHSPWDIDFINLFGEETNLNNIEGRIRKYGDPRIHFAINCASIGCPALSSKAYIESELNSQLDYSAKNFLEDKTRNRLEGHILYLSKIFKWYSEDFKNIKSFIRKYNKSISDFTDIEYLGYDWNLNKR